MASLDSTTLTVSSTDSTEEEAPVHKAQGNEWNNLLFHLPEGWVGRNMVYTATTRGQESVCVITPQDHDGGWPEMIKAAKTPERKRYTRLFR